MGRSESDSTADGSRVEFPLTTGRDMARDPRISNIFYYFEQHTSFASGRTVGRKIGVVQEILCKKLLLTSTAIRDCIIYEPKVPGRSGATHKVEFFLFRPVAVASVGPGGTFEITPGFSIRVIAADVSAQAARVSFVGHAKKRAAILAGMTVKVPGSSLLVKFVRVDSGGLRVSVLDTQCPLASIESKRVGAQRFSGSKKLGRGIQTIEKAKQASLVAIDFDLRYNPELLVASADRQGRAFKSFVVLGNGVHWTPHDLAILETYVDYAYLATDAAVIRYAEFVRALADAQGVEFIEYFMKYFQGMTKTPPDAFTVSGQDFQVLRPAGAESLLSAVERQIPTYHVQVI